mgnify:CR=1 FL=1
MKIKNAEKLAALCLAAVMGVSVTACSGGNMYATSNESATIADNDVITIGSVTTNSGADDRGWDIKPTCKEAEMALCILLNEHN